MHFHLRSFEECSFQTKAKMLFVYAAAVGVVVVACVCSVV